MSCVNVELSGSILEVIIDRPKALNAINSEILDKLEQVVEELPEATRVVVMQGGGDKAFVAGADIEELKDLTPLQIEEQAARAMRVFNGLQHLRTPVIAAIQGFALGGGLELALSCDLRIASSRARFGLPEVNLGIIPGWGGTVRLSRLIGAARAAELIYTGKDVDAAEAFSLGIVNEVVDPDDLEGSAMEFAETIAAKPPIAVEQAKKALQMTQTGLEAYQYAGKALATCFSTQDQKEGMQAFLEKRRPRFVGY